MTMPCGQEKTIGEIVTTLKFFQNAESRREAREERMLKAMEDIAAQGATLEGLSLRTSKAESDLTEAFGVIRTLEQSAASKYEVDKIDLRVTVLEMKGAKEGGAEEVKIERRKVWDGVIQRGTPSVLFVAFFVVYVADKFNIIQWIINILKEMKG